MSTSHDRWHIDRVLGFAMALQSRHGGDTDVLTAAVIMHDLGRSDEQRAHGLASIEASTEIASAVLHEIAYPADRAQRVLTAIREHDQPNLRPTTTEGRILKEADFLAGVGAWGVLRIAMWSGETGRDIQTVMDRLERGMTRRVESLEFPESVAFAQKELVFARLFVERLRLPPELSTAPAAPYVILEGISGSGKDTQAGRLAQRLEERSFRSIVVCEPHGDYKEYKSAWSQRHAELPLTESEIIRWLMTADRQQLIGDRVSSALTNGTGVISVRSYLSTMVYQARTPAEEAAIAFDHSFVPQPAAVIILDLPGDVAWERIRIRDHEKGAFESIEQLQEHRQRYLTLAKQFFGSRSHVVDASVPVAQITDALFGIVAPMFRDLSE